MSNYKNYDYNCYKVIVHDRYRLEMTPEVMEDVDNDTVVATVQQAIEYAEQHDDPNTLVSERLQLFTSYCHIKHSRIIDDLENLITLVTPTNKVTIPDLLLSYVLMTDVKIPSINSNVKRVKNQLVFNTPKQVKAKSAVTYNDFLGLIQICTMILNRQDLYFTISSTTDNRQLMVEKITKLITLDEIESFNKLIQPQREVTKGVVTLYKNPSLVPLKKS